MDDVFRMTSQSGHGSDSARKQKESRQLLTTTFFKFALLACVMCTAPGCSLFVMAGKMIYGDPKVKCGFHRSTGVDLADGEHSLLILVSTPEYMRSEFPSLDLDLSDTIHRRMKLEGVRVVHPDDVADWIDDNGGYWDDLSEIAGDLDADYVAHFDLEEFQYRQPNSGTLYRGLAQGSVKAYESHEIGGATDARQVFVGEFRIEYPRMHPISTDRVSAKVFQQQFIDDLARELSLHFYDHRFGDTF